ncbi:MAG: glycosyltransferase family 2 protein [Chlorobi bacterium]|nr:glycosyltransferase family 2 protein [Chlorobiota bacterium]
MQNKYKISVVIPTLGREKNLISTLKDLAKQNLNSDFWECLIITQTKFSDRFLSEITTSGIKNLRIFFLEEPNASLARNIGLKEAKFDIVLFLDDDIIIENNQFLNNHLSNYDKNPNLCGVFGQVLSVERKKRNERHKLSRNLDYGWLYFPPNFNKPCKTRNGASCNLSVIQKYAVSVGGMDANYVKGAHREETDFCLRLTKKYGLMNFDPEASLIHIGEPTGGVRSWGYNAGVHPMHHITGEWYFILNGLFRYKTIKFYHLHHHIFQILWRQIFNISNLKKIYPVFIAAGKSFAGFFKALKIAVNKPQLYCENVNYEVIK